MQNHAIYQVLYEVSSLRNKPDVLILLRFKVGFIQASLHTYTATWIEQSFFNYTVNRNTGTVKEIIVNVIIISNINKNI